MAERKRIGITFLYDESWAGGMYYILNIINALNYLEDARKPELIIFYANEGIRKKVDTGMYPYLTFLPFYKKASLFRRAVAKGIRIFKKGYLWPAQYPASLVDFVFPCDYMFNHKYNSLQRIRKVYWIPDFQHKHLPHFFTNEELVYRDSAYATLANMNVKLVLSSNSAKTDLVKSYPKHTCTVQILYFASVLPEFMHLDMEKLKERFSIPEVYFFSPNQFWAHKNHMIILKAIVLLKNRQLKFRVVFTGKEHDNRNPEYVTSLKNYIAEQGIGEYVQFLGFIDRAEQLRLMKGACAVIQPSLFEGWSTVVEDAKAMQQTIILSNLEVHLEQTAGNAVYFDPYNEQELAMQMGKCLVNKPTFNYLPYEENIRNYAAQIVEL